MMDKMEEVRSLEQRWDDAMNQLEIQMLSTVEWIGTVRDEFGIAGFPMGDRNVTLRNIRIAMEMLKQSGLIQNKEAYRKAEEAVDKRVAEGEKLLRKQQDL